VKDRITRLETSFQGVKGILQKLGSEAMVSAHTSQFLMQFPLVGHHGRLPRLSAQTTKVNDYNRVFTNVYSFQSNTKPEVKKAKFWDSFVESIDQSIYWVLAILVVISIIAGMINDPKWGWVKGVTILLSITLLVVITAFADYKKDERFVEIAGVAKDEYLPVLRGKAGATQTLDVWKLVVGDVVLLQAGDLVPADCIIIESSQSFKVSEEQHDEGESEFVDHCKSYASDPFLFADSHVLNGTAKVVVVCVGNSETSSRREPDELDLSEESDL